jgi:D-alanyl-D-alanine carboxypeptidase/glutathione synthase/RimK-type ligase-like ATP-grasp enzyme
MAKTHRYSPAAIQPRPRPLRTGLAAEQKATELVEEARTDMEQGHDARAMNHLTAALKIDPLCIDANLLQAQLLMKHKKHDTALLLLQTALLQQPDDYDSLVRYARCLSEVGKTRLALATMHRCVQLRPNHDAPRRYLAALYGTLGFEEHSRYWAQKAVRSKAFHVREASKETQLTVLALFTQASGSLGINRQTFGIQTSEGHNNLASLLDNDHVTVIRFQVDTLDSQPELLRKLPPADVIYNSITDPERCEHALHLAQKVCDRLDLPVLNPPSQVLASSRESNYARFKDNSNVILPKSVKIESTQESAKSIVEQAMKAHGFKLPVIIRLAGFQGGKYMHKVDDLETHDFAELDKELAKQPQTLYVVQYHEFGYRDAHMPNDMLYLKYRAFLIGGKLYPAHLRGDINQYKVHINNQIFDLCPWAEDFEDHFMRDPADYFGGDNWQHLEDALNEMGLDYTGVDFAVAKAPEHQGKILIFEANASMRNWPTLRNDTPHVYAAWQNNLQGVHQHFCAKADIEPWEFVVPQIEAPTTPLKAQSVVSIDRDPTGESGIILNNNGEAVVKPASLTMVMLSMVVLDTVNDLDEHIDVIDGDIIGGSGNNLLAGDTLSWKDALRNMLMTSSNVTANVVGRHLGKRLLSGKEYTPEQARERGVQALNDKAKQLGMEATRFTNPSGLDHADMRTTANDMATMGSAALAYPELLAAWGDATYTLHTQGKMPREMAITSTVKPLVDGQANVVGGKTGTLPDGTQNLMLHTRTAQQEDRITVLMQVGGDRYVEMQQVLTSLEGKQKAPTVPANTTIH